jgi:hypothetical protein
MRNHKTEFLLIALLTVTGLFLQACTTESSLSEEEISDPSLISPRFSVKRTKSIQSGTTSYLHTAVLKDAQGDHIELLYGNVTVNGVRLKAFNLFGIPTEYRLSSNDMKVELDSLYTYTIKLSDGQVYASSVRTPASTVLTATVSTIGDSLLLVWTGNNTDSILFEYDTKISLTDTTETAKRYEQSFAPNGKYEAKVKLPAGRAFTGSFYVAAFTRGTVHPAFLSGGRAIAYAGLESK